MSGQSARVVIPQAAPIGVDAVYRKYQDGGPNDADGQANGVIKDPGGVGSFPQAVADDNEQVRTTSSGGGGGGGGGGCITGTRDTVDPLLPLMLLLSVLVLVKRRFGLM